jgi:hypothetical protein
MVDSNPICLLCASARVLPQWSLRPVQILEQLSHEWGLHNPKGPAIAQLNEAEKLTHYICLECDAGFWFPLIPGDSDFYESISTTYVGTRWDKTIIRKFIKKSSSVLDVGAGPDPIFLNLTKKCDTQHATIDINPYANAKIPSSYAKFSNLGDSVIANNQFNDITALHFLEHIENPLEYFRGLVKMMAPGGSIWISVPNRERTERHFPFDSLDTPPHHVTSWNLKSLQFFAARLDLQMANAWASKHRSKFKFIRGVHRFLLRKEYYRVIFFKVPLARKKNLRGYQILVQLKAGN